jgi:hypothetical protein
MTQPEGPPYQVPPAQTPQLLPSPKKKANKAKTILLSVGGIILFLVWIGVILAILGGGGDPVEPAAPVPTVTTDDPVEPEPDPTIKEPEPEPVKEYKIGQPATDEAYQFTVTKIKCGVARVGDQYLSERAQGQFCLISLRVKNVGDSAINFSAENQALFDTKGNDHSPDDAAWIYLDNAGIYQEINPGNTLKTTVPFDIPKSAKPDYLLLKAGTFGFAEGVRVKVS